MNPLVSVIMPVHNNETTLLCALDSIRHQTYRNLEIIVVDDASTDHTKQIAGQYVTRDARVKVISAPDDPYRIDIKLERNVNAGWSARNAGLAIARGELITFQDGDDASLLNRIEVQVGLLQKYNATHIITGWQPFNEQLVGTILDLGSQKPPVPLFTPTQLSALSQKTKGLVAKLSLALNAAVHFYFKRIRLINKLFFGSLESFPGAGNNPLFTREVLERVQFRPLKNRVWPSFMGRGADRDFNFQVVETFKNSYFFDIPLYLWDTNPSRKPSL